MIDRYTIKLNPAVSQKEIIKSLNEGKSVKDMGPLNKLKAKIEIYRFCRRQRAGDGTAQKIIQASDRLIGFRDIETRTEQYLPFKAVMLFICGVVRQPFRQKLNVFQP